MSSLPAKKIWLFTCIKIIKMAKEKEIHSEYMKEIYRPSRITIKKDKYLETAADLESAKDRIHELEIERDRLKFEKNQLQKEMNELKSKCQCSLNSSVNKHNDHSYPKL